MIVVADYQYFAGYKLFNVRGGFTLNENSMIFIAFENIFDNFIGIRVGELRRAGRNLLVQYRYKF